jgi:hypothetical protein
MDLAEVSLAEVIGPKHLPQERKDSIPQPGSLRQVIEGTIAFLSPRGCTPRRLTSN